MSKKIRPGQHVIVWNPRASTRVRSCAEPYEIRGEYNPNEVDPNHRKRGYNSHAVVDEQVQRSTDNVSR